MAIDYSKGIPVIQLGDGTTCVGVQSIDGIPNIVFANGCHRRNIGDDIMPKEIRRALVLGSEVEVTISVANLEAGEVLKEAIQLVMIPHVKKYIAEVLEKGTVIVIHLAKSLLYWDTIPVVNTVFHGEVDSECSVVLQMEHIYIQMEYKNRELQGIEHIRYHTPDKPAFYYSITKPQFSKLMEYISEYTPTGKNDVSHLEFMFSQELVQFFDDHIRKELGWDINMTAPPTHTHEYLANQLVDKINQFYSK